METAIIQLEDFTGKKFDFDKLSEVMKLSNATCQWWKMATDLAANKPSPLNGFDMFNYMAIMVCMRGNADGHKLFKMWYEELKAKADAGKGRGTLQRSSTASCGTALPAGRICPPLSRF